MTRPTFKGLFQPLSSHYYVTLGKSFDLAETQFLTFNGTNNAPSTQSYCKSEIILQAYENHEA